MMEQINKKDKHTKDIGDLMQHNIENMSNNTLKSSRLLPDCSNTGENSKNLFLQLKNQKNNNVPYVPPSFSKNRIENIDVKIGKIAVSNNMYRIKNREGTRNIGTFLPDKRFQSPGFREAVRVVLEYFGFENPTYKDFKDVEDKFRLKDGRVGLDWMEFAQRVLNPRYEAVVYVLDQMKNRCAKIGVTLFGSTREEALKTLDTKCYEFCRWFDFPEGNGSNSLQDESGCDETGDRANCTPCS